MFGAETGVAAFGVTPSSVVLRTPNALSVMLRPRDRRRGRAYEAHRGAEAQVLIVLGVVAERVRVVVRRRCEDASDRPVLSVHEVRRHRVAGHLNRRAGGHTHAVLAEERSGRQRQRRRDRVAAARRLAVAVDQGRVGVARRRQRRVVVVLARVASDDLVVREDRVVDDARRHERCRRQRVRRVVARRAVDEHADRVVGVDARVVDRQRAHEILRLDLRPLLLPGGGDVRDADAERIAPEAAGDVEAVRALVEHEARHA